jgi:RHS repeat-associated protein
MFPSSADTAAGAALEPFVDCFNSVGQHPLDCCDCVGPLPLGGPGGGEPGGGGPSGCNTNACGPVGVGSGVGGGGPSPPRPDNSNTISKGGSYVQNRAYLYVHWAYDYQDPSGSEYLSILRSFRSRFSGIMSGSFGPSHFMQYDLHVRFDFFEGNSAYTNNVTNGAVVGNLTEGLDADSTFSSSEGSVFSLGTDQTGTEGYLNQSAPQPSRFRRIELLNSLMQPASYGVGTGGVSSFVDPKYLRGTMLDGRILTFECINTSVYPAPSSGSNRFTHGRLVRYQFPNGKEIQFTYKRSSTNLPPQELAELIADPTLQWQIDTISDGQRSIGVQYKSTQVAGAWVISQFTYPGGRTTSYTYGTSSLTSITHADGTQSTFSYQNGPNSLLKLSINDPVAEPLHRKKDIWHSGTFALTESPEGEDEIVVTAWGITRVIGSGANETSYASILTGEPGPYGLQNSFVAVYEGGGVLQIPNLFPSGGRRFYEAWELDTDTNDNFVFVNTIKEPTYEGAYVGSTIGAISRTPMYTTHTQGGAAGFVVYNDNTFDAYCYIPNTDRITRYRDRQGNVTRYTYDSAERLIQKEEGLRDHPNNIAFADPYGNGFSTLYYNRCATNDVQTAEYAVTTYEYYGSGVAGVGLRKAEIDPRGNRTDWEYNSGGMVTKITRPSDTPGGTRPVTLYAYDTAGRLVSTTDPEGRVVTREYDSMDRLTKIIYGDGTSDQMIYGGVASGSNAGLLVKTIDRLGVVTTYAYDGADRLTTKVTAAAKLDSSNNEVATPDLASTETFTYINGTSRIATHTRSGAKTEYAYDYRGRVSETRHFPRAGVELVTKRVYLNNQLHYTEDPYGRRTYYGYDSANGRVIRTVQYTIPGQSLATNAAVINLTRSTAANPTAIITDIINDANGQPIQRIDARGTITKIAYDSRGRTKEQIAAFGIAGVESKTETLYDAASNVIEVRSPRYFDSADTLGSAKARETWTYTGRNLVATHTEAPGTPEAATESFTYTLSGRRSTQVDFRGNTWTTNESGCCALTRTSIDPLGHGTITNANSKGQIVHTATVSDVSTHSSNYNNPIDAKTLSETTTRYDGRGRPIYQTTWLTPRGIVDTANPPIAGLNGIATAQGLTTQYLYDDTIGDNVGLDSQAGLTVPRVGRGGRGSTNNLTVSLKAALTQLASPQASGGAGISFSTIVVGKATVTINPEDEISFSISDSAGRTVMSGKLQSWKGEAPAPAPGSLVNWSCTLHDATQNLAGYGTVLETRSIDALGFATRTWTDAAGRTMRSLDQLDKATAFTYDAGGNQLSVRDPNSVGADMLYDALGRNTQRTDTFGDVTKTDYDRAGNAIKQTDAKNKFTLISFDARNRRKSTSDRIGAATTFTYLPTGQLASLTDAENQVTSYTYDARGSKLTEQYPDHVNGAALGTTGYGIVTLVYDNAGRILRKQDQAGDTCTYNYDLAGRLTNRNYRTAANSPSGTIADSDTFTFDHAGRMLTANSGRYANTVSYQYDPIGRKNRESLTIASKTYTVVSGFNFRNELVKQTYPDSSVSERSYDARGALYQLKLDGSTVDTRSYDDGGRITSEVLGNGITETRAYRTDNLVSSISYSNTNIGNLSYSWDANKNKTGETIAGVMSGYGFSASGTTYDFEDRLTAFARGNGTMTQSWNLTPVGDWTSVTTNGATQTRTHGPTHELLTAGAQNVTTDVKGNMTIIPASLRQNGDPLQANWDFDNRLRDAESTTVNPKRFLYDALGRRVACAEEGEELTIFVQSDQQTVADYDETANISAPTCRYVWGSYIDEPVVRKTAGSGGTTLYYHRNQQYSIYALSDSSGTVTERYAYTAYGQPTFLNASATVQANSAANNRYTYTAREWDATIGLYHFRARWMSGLSGRFCSRDPIGYEDGMSTYSFVINSPLDATDPSGLTVSDCYAYSEKEVLKFGPMAVWRFELEGSFEMLYSGQMCRKDCKAGCEKERAGYLSGTISGKGKFKLSGPGAVTAFGIPITFKWYGGAEGGAYGTFYHDFCTGDEGYKKCTFNKAFFGFEKSEEVDSGPMQGSKISIKGEGYIRRNCCEEKGKPSRCEVCGGFELKSEACFKVRVGKLFRWERCREVRNIDISNCGNGDAGH